MLLELQVYVQSLNYIISQFSNRSDFSQSTAISPLFLKHISGPNQMWLRYSVHMFQRSILMNLCCDWKYLTHGHQFNNHISLLIYHTYYFNAE